MSIEKLRAKLDEALDDFAKEVKFNRETADAQVTHDDIEELGRQTFYALGRFRDIIIEHLKQR